MTHIHILKALLLFKILILALVFPFFANSQELKLVFVGDIMQHGGQIAGAKNQMNGDYFYDDCFSYVKPIIEDADFAIANLEVTLGGEPYTGYPQFSAPDQLSQALKNAGFDVLLTSNNHACDRGNNGVKRTINVLDSIQIQHLGTYNSDEERNEHTPIILQKNGIKIALLNYTYGTNGLSVKKPQIINYLDSTIILNDIEKAKAAKVDYIFACVHWGIEYQHLPSLDQKKWAQFMTENGIDVIIGGHPHVLQPAEWIGKKHLTFWSFGNFVSNQRKRYTDGGMIAEITITKDSIKNVQYIPTWVYPKKEATHTPFYIIPLFDGKSLINDSLFITLEIASKIETFRADTKSLFDEHNVKVTEMKLTDFSKTLQDEMKLISSNYYSVIIAQNSVNECPRSVHQFLTQFLITRMDNKGNYLFLSGEYPTIEEAKEQIKHLEACGLADLKIAYISPSEIAIQNE